MTSITDEAVERLTFKAARAARYATYAQIDGTELSALLSTLLSKDREIARLREAVRNASGLLDTPLGRRRHAGDDFYEAVVESIRQALSTTQDEGKQGVSLARADLSSAKRADLDGERSAGKLDVWEPNKPGRPPCESCGLDWCGVSCGRFLEDN